MEKNQTTYRGRRRLEWREGAAVLQWRAGKISLRRVSLSRDLKEVRERDEKTDRVSPVGIEEDKHSRQWELHEQSPWGRLGLAH